MLKLVAVDMDGTFLRDDKTYDEKRFARLYAKLQAKRIQFVVASGDQYFQLKSFFKPYPDIIYIAENGAFIRGRQKTYALHQYKAAAIKEIEQFLLQQKEIHFLVCGAQNAYELTKFGQEYYDLSHPYYFHLRQVASLAEIHDQILKFSVRCPLPKAKYYLRLFGQKLGNVCQAASSGYGDIDLIQPGIHKAHGLKELGQILHIPLKDMCAFGDAGNDYEMMREVGDGVAMANADPQLLRVADHQTASNNDQGVLTYLEHLLSD